MIVNFANEELRKSSLTHLERLWTLEQIERMQNAGIREGRFPGSSGVDVQIPRTLEASKIVQTAHTFI